MDLFVVGFPSGILDNESRKRSEPRSGSTRFTPVGSSLDKARLEDKGSL